MDWSMTLLRSFPFQVVDLLIFKGREELETYLMMHKQRHHLVRGGIANLLALVYRVHIHIDRMPFVTKFLAITSSLYSMAII